MEGRLSYKKVLGSRNPADALTKYMPGPLMSQHMTTLGLEARGGRADSAPTIDTLECHTDAWRYKRVRFHGMVQIVRIPSEGRGHPVSRARRAQWQAPEFEEFTTAGTMTTTAEPGDEAQGEIQGRRDLGSARPSLSVINCALSSTERNRRGNK